MLEKKAYSFPVADFAKWIWKQAHRSLLIMPSHGSGIRNTIFSIVSSAHIEYTCHKTQKFGDHCLIVHWNITVHDKNVSGSVIPALHWRCSHWQHLLKWRWYNCCYISTLLVRLKLYTLEGCYVNAQGWRKMSCIVFIRWHYIWKRMLWGESCCLLELCFK